jgi:hypothetical protein
MKNKPSEMDDELRPEYDLKTLLKGAVRGKHAKAMREGYTVTIHQEDGATLVQNFTLQENAVVLDPDVRAHYPDSESVNNALRSLMAQPLTKGGQVGEKKAKYGK